MVVYSCVKKSSYISHHINKFLEINFSIWIVIDFLHQFPPNLLIGLHLFKDLFQLIYIDVSVAVIVKEFKCCFQALFREELFSVHGCCDEFRVVDAFVVILINHFKNSFNLSLRIQPTHLIAISQYKFLPRQLPIVIGVEILKHLH